MQLVSESLADYSRVLMQLQNRMVQAAASEAESAALVLLRDNELKEQFVQCVREQSVRQELRRIAYHSVGKSFHHMRDETLYLFQEHDERYHTMQVRGAEVGEEGYRDEPVSIHTRGQEMDSPLQMMQAHQQLQSQVLQLGSQQNEMANMLRAVLNTFPQGHVVRPISVPANMPSHHDGLCFFCKHKGHVIRDCPRKTELNVIQSHKSSCDAEKHVKLQEENDQLKETFEKMKNTSVSDLNKRDTKWKRERHQLTVDLQRVSKDASELNMQLMTLKAKSPEAVTRIERVEVESDTCKLALEKCSANLDQSRKETRCLQSKVAALGNKYQDVEQRLAKVMEHTANLQPFCRDHDELTGRLRLLESESVERNDQLNDSDTVLLFGDPCPIETTDDHLASRTLTNHVVCRSIWANIPSHSNPAHFPMAG